MDWDDPAQRAALIERVGPQEYNRLHQQQMQDSIIETVGGHAIRPVRTRLYGTLFAVGGTEFAFGTMGEARTYAAEHPAA